MKVNVYMFSFSIISSLSDLKFHLFHFISFHNTNCKSNTTVGLHIRACVYIHACCVLIT